MPRTLDTASPREKPASKANGAPASKPASRAAAAKPASTRPPSSRRGAAPAAAAEVAEPKDEAETKEEDARPAKKGRVAELNGENKPKRSRVSLNNRELNRIPERSNDVHKTVFVFGEGSMGQHGLGPGDDEMESIPRPRVQTWLAEEAKKGSLAKDGKSLGGIEEIACGGMHTLAIDEAGNVRSWGVNDGAALGRLTAKVANPDKPGENIPSDELEAYPFVIESLKKEGFRAVRVVAGDSVSVALGDKGELRCWGSFRSDDGLLGFDGSPNGEKRQFTPMAIPAFAKVKMAQVACGSDHVLALTTTGHVYVWGNGSQSQLGRKVLERRRLNGLHPERMGLRNIVHVAAGQYHSFAIDEKGEVYGWGLNTFHQLGITPEKGGDADMIITPSIVDGLSPKAHNGSRVIQIEGGEHHSLFLFDNGEVWACGRSDAHQCGVSKDHPAQDGLKQRRDEIKAEKKVKVDQAQEKLAKLEADGKTEEEKSEAMTDLAAAQASFAAALDEYIPEPVRVYFPEIPETYEEVPDFPDMDEAKEISNPIAQLSAGTRHNLAISRSGHVYSWGLGVDQQLGLGQQETAEVPTLVRSKFLRPYTALSASAGGQHCAVLAKEGEANKGPNATD